MNECEFVFTILAQNYYNAYGSHSSDGRNRINETETIIWCTVSKQEQKKCENFAQAMERDKIRDGFVTFTLECKHVCLGVLLHYFNSSNIVFISLLLGV